MGSDNQVTWSITQPTMDAEIGERLRRMFEQAAASELELATITILAAQAIGYRVTEQVFSRGIFAGLRLDDGRIWHPYAHEELASELTAAMLINALDREDGVLAAGACGRYLATYRPDIESRAQTARRAILGCAAMYPSKLPYRERSPGIIPREDLAECVTIQISSSTGSVIAQTPMQESRGAAEQSSETAVKPLRNPYSADHELLVLAAKAAGYAVKEIPERMLMDPPQIGLWVSKDGVLVHTCWNPLQDRGAALQLAYDVRYDVVFEPRQTIDDACRGIVKFAAWLGMMQP